MKPGVAPNFVSALKPFHQSTIAALDEQPSGSFSGISKDGSYCWLVRGSQLEVLDIATRNRLGAWQFGKVLGDQHTNVTCVTEFCMGQARKLLVGVCNASATGLLCLFNVAQSKITKAIEIPNPVTEIEVVCTESKRNMPRWSLSEQLRYFCGLVAVGTDSGHVYLVDMALDDIEFYSDEEVPSKVHFVCPRNRDTENQRYHCMSQGFHLCMTLNENLFTRQGFEYQKPDGIVMKTFQPERISVSCLKYVPQAGLLVIGYNFGCFQLWKLSIPVLEYSSRLEFEQMPVTHIAYQEPENDPKNFCYLWVARGHGVTDEELECVSSISMYQLAFSHKSFYNNYGVFYDELISICLRLSHELTSTPIQHGSNFEGTSRVVACHTLADANYQPPVMLKQDESYEEGSHAPDLSLCVFVWEVTEHGSASTGRHLAVFDINRWYHAQMPSSIRFVGGSSERCSYFSFCRVDEAAEKADYENVLAVHLVADRLRKFVSTSVIPPEQHFYPASLAFDAKLVFEVGVVEAEFMGAQRQVLANLERLGARALTQPHDLHSLCVYVGLLPQLVDGGHAVPNPAQQREALLSLALDYNLVSFLKSCIVQWSSGEYEHQGCSLKLLIDWLWEKVSTTKHQIDTTCVNLYNWSGLSLDQRALQVLQQCDRRLKHLLGLLQAFIQTGPMTEQGEMDLQSKVIVTSLLSHHLNVVLWFVGAELLPEREARESVVGSKFCYPSAGLTLAYKKRRTELQQIHSELKDGDLLMIDGLVEFLGVGELWDREGGSGLYPPPSLHALLSSYLLENVDSLSKHCLVLYLLLDLVSLDNTDDKDDFSEKVLKFAQRFCVPHTLVKCIQAFWLLDHRDFEEALVLLLDPLVTAEFSRWQHGRVVRALLYQGDARMALRYITSVRPALTTPEEVKLKLTVLLANGMTAEALEYQRVSRDQNNSTDLLTHLFHGCQQMKTVDRLLQLPLTAEEEAILVAHLSDSSEPHAQELLVMHYLQRARFIEAIQLNEKLKHTIMVDANPKARERAAARNAIVDSFARLLPNVQRRLMFEQAHIPKKAPVQHSVCAKPTPLSTKITQNQANVMSRSAFIFTIIEKLDEIETEESPGNETMNKSLGPFICTPVTPARKSLKCDPAQPLSNWAAGLRSNLFATPTIFPHQKQADFQCVEQQKTFKRDTPVTAFPEPVEKPGIGSGHTTLNMSVFAFQDGDTPKGMDKRQSRFFSASCLSLLQTPKVQQLGSRTPSKTSASVVTPKSIMKIRSISAKLSPSPHSTGTTPNSQELEGSARKLPRKLGYGTASQSATPTIPGDQPLSSVPRHLAHDMGSLPSSPRPTSQPTTPKSVSFADSTFSKASKLKGLSTPVKALTPVRFREPEKESLSTPSEADSEESPFPPSSRSPDQLQRRPLRTTPPKQLDEEQENISDDDVEEMDVNEPTPELSLRISPSTSGSSGVSPQTTPPPSPQKSPKKPTSPTVKISKSPISAFSSKSRDSISEEQVSSAGDTVPDPVPANNIETAEKVDIDLTEDDDMEVDNDGEEPRVTEEQKTEMIEVGEEITPAEDLVEDEDLVEEEEGMVEEEGMEAGAVSSSDGEMPSQEVEAEAQSMKQEVEAEAQSVKQEVEEAVMPPPEQLPSSSSKQEEEWRELPRKPLPAISERPIKLITPESSPGSSSSREVSPAFATKRDQILKMIDEQFAESPQLPGEVTSTEVQVVKTRTRTRRTFDIKAVKVENRESRERSTDKEIEVDKAVTSVDDNEKAGQSSEPFEAVKQEEFMSTEENVEAVEPEAELQKEEMESNKEVEEPTTPSRARQTRQKDVTAPETPTRSSRRFQKKSEESETDEKPLTPTRSSRRRTVVKEEPVVTGKLVEISVKSPKEFSQEAKEAVQESLLQISENMKRDLEASPTNMTKLKHKDISEPVLRTPPRSSRRTRKSETPTREVYKVLDETAEHSGASVAEKAQVSSPRTRRSRKTDSSASPVNEKISTKGDSENIAPESRSPSRNNRNNSRNSPARLSVDTTEISLLVQAKRTPTRSRRKKDSFDASESKDLDIGAQSVLPDEAGIEMDTNNSGRQSFEISEIPVDYVEDPVEKSPSRRRSLRNYKSVSDELPRTPTRRQSLAHSAKLLKEENKQTSTTGAIDTAQTQSPLVRTPSRRGRPKKIEIGLEGISENETLVLTPSRRGRAKKTEKDEEENIEPEKEPSTPSRRGRAKKGDVSETEIKSESENEPSTPSRRGRSKKSDTSVVDDKVESENEPSTPSRRGRPKKGDTSVVDDKSEIGKEPTTPSRRGRPKKVDSETETETEPSTPSRRGKAKKTETETVSDIDSDITNVPVTPTRRGRSKKDETLETEVKAVTPSRRGRPKKSEPVDMEMAPEEEPKVTTPSRKGRGRKAEPETKAEDEQLNLTPSRSKRRKQDKESPSRTEVNKDEGSKERAISPRVSNTELYDLQRTSFMFAGPQVLEEMEIEGPGTPVKPFTPSKSFIFSPPIATHTRSRSREKHEEEKGILLPPGETETSVKEALKEEAAKKPAKKPAKKSRNRKLYTEKDEVLLISPMAQDKDDSGSEGLAIVTRTTRAGARKVETKKDGTQLLLKKMDAGSTKTSYRMGRPRASHRFGPVGKKKAEK